MTATTVTTLDSATIASMIAKRQSIPQDTDLIEVRKGISIVLAKAGKAISPISPNANKILPILQQIDDLVEGDTGLVTRWAAIRALGLKSGSQTGVSGIEFENPISMTLLAAAGIVPTIDTDATVRAQLGDLEERSMETLTSNGRIVTISSKGDIVASNGTGTIFTVNAAADPIGAVSAIDSKSITVKNTANQIAAIQYNCVEAAELSEFNPTVFSSYKVRRLDIPGAHPHPTELVESSALASVLPPEPNYKPWFHPEVIQKGILSDVQMETVISAGEAHSKYLASHPDDKNLAAPRQGFLMGHGPGFGKGRTIAAIFADNWAQGRRRGIWFSESARLIKDARRDWKALGGDPKDIIDIREMSAKDPIPPFNGIIFATYAALRSETESGSRRRQLIDWFGPSEDGVIVFDEAQNLRNSKKHKGTRKTNIISEQGQAAAELQNAAPNARVVYASATSASDIASLGFATRLGLWGSGTSFATATAFFKAVEQGGINALEMIARDLKAMGLYLAANLSFEGVSYERLERPLTPEERQAHDVMSAIWAKVGLGLKKALLTTGISSLPGRSATRSSNAGAINYGMSRARFFQATLAALKTPMLIEEIRKDLKNGDASIVQMQNTFAANADRAIEAAINDGEDIDDVEATPRDILISYMEKSFPIYKYAAKKQGRHTIAGKVLGPNGQPVVCPQAKALRDQLVAEINATDIPEGPLEQLFNAFGAEMIAEITGRQQRLVPTLQGGRLVEQRSSDDVESDAKAFFDDEKRILVFSAAGATGATYSASRSYRNQRKRRHYVLQPGWRADQTIQGMGRSHRSDQAQPPEYILLTTDLWADQRIMSAIASGMQELGALTRGQRQAASQDFFTSDENLEDEFGQAAWTAFATKLHKGLIQGLSIAQFELEAGIKMRNGQGALNRPLPPVKRFLNAMSAMSYDNQMLFGRHYRKELQQLRLQAIQSGEFDRGIETITPDSLIKLEDAVIFRDPRTGGETRLLKMLRIDELDPLSYQEARRMAMQAGNARVMKSLITGRIAMLAFPRSSYGRPPSGDDPVRVITPTGARTRTRDELLREGWTLVDITFAEQLWNAELQERGLEEEQMFWVVTGAMLPIWNKLPRDRPTVYRMETDEGEQVIGRLVADDFVDKLLSRVNATTGGGLSLQEVDEAITKDGVVTLVNGWTITGHTSKFTGTQSFTLTMPASEEHDYSSLISGCGMTKTVGFLRSEAYFRLPTGEAERHLAIQEITKEAPAASAAVI